MSKEPMNYVSDDICRNDYVLVRMKVQFDCTKDIVFVQDYVGEQITVHLRDVRDVEQALQVGDKVRKRRYGTLSGEVGCVCGVSGDLAWVKWEAGEHLRSDCHEIIPIADIWRYVEQKVVPALEVSA